MNPDDLGWAFLFLVVVGLIIVVGFVVGMIVAGRLDKLQAPRPSRPQDRTPVGGDGGEAGPGTPTGIEQPVQEEQQP